MTASKADLMGRLMKVVLTSSIEAPYDVMADWLSKKFPDAKHAHTCEFTIVDGKEVIKASFNSVIIDLTKEQLKEVLKEIDEKVVW